MEEAKGKLEVKLSVERSMKIQAINKLAEVLNTKEFQLKESKKNVPSSDLAEKEKENKGSQNKLAWVRTFFFHNILSVKILIIIPGPSNYFPAFTSGH